MTFENLTADADALRKELGYERWAVLGHSFGGHVALEYALRYPAACRTWYSSTPAATAAGPGTMPPGFSPAVAAARRGWNWRIVAPRSGAVRPRGVGGRDASVYQRPRLVS
jgi:pimeloyl-ACP methyl ester carboxylesterase